MADLIAPMFLQRSASNVYEQLNIIFRGSESHIQDSSHLFCLVLPTANTQLKEFAKLSTLRSYIHQADVARVLENIEIAIDALMTILPSVDPILKEDLESQKEIINTDRSADGIQLRRLLRDALRKEPLNDLSHEEIHVLVGALKIELSSSSISPDIAQLYEQVLARIEPELENQTKQGDPDNLFEDLTGKVVRISDVPVARGAITTVWSGELFGKPVSIFTAMQSSQRVSDEDLDAIKDGMVWSTFRHKNVLPLLGIIRNFGKYHIALVTPWMVNGTVIEYLRKNPGADRLKIITDFVRGLAYLHTLNPPYVHGILTESVLLVDEHGNGILAGFASTMFESSIISKIRYQAPESYSFVQNGSELKHDIYSFAMVVLSILTGNKPFSYFNSGYSIISAVKSGQRPPRPNQTLVHRALDDKLWDIIVRCWSQDPDERPSASQILQELEDLRRLPDLDVHDLTNVVRLYESVHSITASGGFGDVRRGFVLDYGPVALKTLVVKGQAQPELRRFRREATIWSKLQHPNILPFLGVADIMGLSTCLVSPWKQNGNCTEYLKVRGLANHIPIIAGICRGLVYLHGQNPPVIHGDLRGANVLIGDDEQPLLCDFGLAVIVEDLANMPISSALQGSGNPRWMAPELLIGEEIVSPQSDVWSLGMVMLEIFTLDIPFCDLKGYPQVILTLHGQGRPTRPGIEASNRGLTDDIWALMMFCWAQSPHDRPSAVEALQMLEQRSVKETMLSVFGSGQDAHMSDSNALVP
ncbi:kinase-like protein [Schizopora paradoxa]|uniref:Kinase-like protein n=1 Tax=Schizopora paradoxa TaxID=27342 RepID=A0A0H2RY32_9AGAM|nr:kinase-like protein [Schizopora paradoxa]